MASEEKMFNYGILFVTKPLQCLDRTIPQLLEKSAQSVKSILYVHLQPDTVDIGRINSDNNGLRPQLLTVPSNPQIRNSVFNVYQHGSAICPRLDVRVLLSHITSRTKHPSESLLSSSKYKYTFKNNWDAVFIDRKLNPEERILFLQDLAKLFPLSHLADVHSIEINIDNTDSEDISASQFSENDIDTDLEIYRHSVMGGTFDRLHAGHKILLSDACLRCSKSVTVGVTEGKMNAKKSLPELMLPVDQRIRDLRDFMEDVKPRLEYKLEPITDMFGPSTIDPYLECIVVSQETLRGGQKVNDERQRKGLSILDVYSVDLMEDKHHSPEEEVKISSSSGRKRLLGTLLREVKAKPELPHVPYRIGLTGGIASGKSSVCKRLQKLGATIIDCDKLGHQAYLKGSRAFVNIVEEFGQGIIGLDGEINRKALGGIVFSDKLKLIRLNEIVWPEIARMVEEQIQGSEFGGKSVVVLDAAVLLEAGWDNMVHEVWSAIIPVEEAVKRIQERNHLSEEEALKRINSQMTSDERVHRSNVVLSTLWEYEVTQKQVEKAWNLLQERLNKEKSQL